MDGASWRKVAAGTTGVGRRVHGRWGGVLGIAAAHWRLWRLVVGLLQYLTILGGIERWVWGGFHGSGSDNEEMIMGSKYYFVIVVVVAVVVVPVCSAP